MSTRDRINIGNLNLFDSDSLVGCQIEIVQSDNVVGHHHKVEVVPKTERVQQDPLRLRVLESNLVTLSLLNEKQSQFRICYLHSQTLLRRVNRNGLNILSARLKIVIVKVVLTCPCLN